MEKQPRYGTLYFSIEFRKIFHFVTKNLQLFQNLSYIPPRNWRYATTRFWQNQSSKSWPSRTISRRRRRKFRSRAKFQVCLHLFWFHEILIYIYFDFTKFWFTFILISRNFDFQKWRRSRLDQTNVKIKSGSIGIVKTK